MDWLFYALGAAIGMAGADALTKHHLSGYPPTLALLVRTLFPALFLAPLLLVVDPPDLEPRFWLWLGAAMPLEILAEFLYIKALRSSPLALSVPYLAFTPVFIAATGLVLLGESVSLLGFAGILLVGAGAYYLNLESDMLSRPGGWREPLAAIARQPGARYMLGVALIYSFTAVLAKGTLLAANSLAATALYFLGIAVCSSIALSLREPGILRRAFGNVRVHASLGLVLGFSALCTFLAFAQVETAYAIAVKRTSILFSILLGAWFFHERRLPRHFTAGLVMVGGVALMVLK